MNKDKIFGISIIVNILLAIIIFGLLADASHKIKYDYVREERIEEESLQSALDEGSYGVAAATSHSIRGGAKIPKEYEDYYRLGEYTDLLFLKEVFTKAGNTDTVTMCENRISKIREEMSDYGVLFDKIDQSVDKAIRE